MPLMKILHMIRTTGLALFLLLAVGCASRRVDPRTLAPDDIWARATQEYEQGDYGAAIPFLEAFVEQHLGDPRAPEALMRLGRSHAARREYISAASYFQRLAEDFPSSPLNLEARYSICTSYLRLSPKPQLDQEYTRAAVDHCGSVATNYPGTAQGDSARAHVARMRDKLADKEYLNGLHYQRRRVYDAAVISFSDVAAEYPETSFAPLALRRLIEVYGVLGYVEEVAETRARLLRDYPNDPAAQDLPPADTSAASR
jgi:outer membrane protein assembly factor BamD